MLASNILWFVLGMIAGMILTIYALDLLFNPRRRETKRGNNVS